MKEPETGKQICVGLLAHVDAGKTTLAEGLLYTAGTIRRMGRVDNRDAFLDTDEREKARGITIFAKQAELTVGESRFTLIDTPGHVDFSAETERVLQVLDAAILVISGPEGVQGHTLTLWKLLARHRIPVFLFVNKMDQTGCSRERILSDLRRRLDENCVDFGEAGTTPFFEQVSTCGEEELLDRYLEEGSVDDEEICRLIEERNLFPCYFGSALRMQGIAEFLEGLDRYTRPPRCLSEMGAKIFKIARDPQGNRLTFLKVTGGSLSVRQVLTYEAGGERREEKISQIRRYCGSRYETMETAGAGTVCALLGLTATFPGQGLGAEAASEPPALTPVLTYRLLPPEGVDPAVLLPKLRILEEENPELSVVWEESVQEIRVSVMGDVQREILQSLLSDRFGLQVRFGEGAIVYRETIADTVEGVGHFEPLRHYAEVHLLLEPGQPGSGLVYASDCREEVLGKNWQRLVLTHLAEKTHRGVLTGSPITDMKITLIAGRAHVKHTEGGDFRQATYRAVRQGLRQADSILLEPWYEFTLQIPSSLVGRAMTDLENRKALLETPETVGEWTTLTGSAPVAVLQNYQREVTAYSRGEGVLTLNVAGYRPCHNTEEVVARIGYDPETDAANPTGSVFCTHGTSFSVPWDEVQNYMHVESRLPMGKGEEKEEETRASGPEEWIGTDEIDAILARTFYANGRDRSQQRRGIGGRREYSRSSSSPEPVRRTFRQTEKKPEVLLVDAYNIIFSWPELNAMARENVDRARQTLLDLMCNYQGVRGCEVIVVFDAYRVPGHREEFLDYLNIHVVYTKEAELADQYIERFTHENASKFAITVATSDGLEQIIIRGAGSRLLSARDLREEVGGALRGIRETLDAGAEGERRFLLDGVTDEVASDLEKIRRGEDGPA